MGYDTDRIAIESRFKTIWGNTTAIAWDNIDFNPSDDTEWVRIAIVPGEEQFVSMGKMRKVGVIIIQIFVPEFKGSKRSNELIDLTTKTWRNKEFSGIRCREITVNRLGQSNGWFQTNVSIPFWKEESL